MLEVAIRRWVNSGNKRMQMISNNTQTGCGIQALIDWYLQTQSVPRKHSPHHYTTSTSLNCWCNTVWINGFMLLTPNSEPTICVPLMRFIRPDYIFPTVQFWTASAFCYWLNPKWSSAVVAHLSQGLTCCAFWDAFLLTTVVKVMWCEWYLKQLACIGMILCTALLPHD